MRIHHINCATMCPVAIERLVCHCLVVETDHGLVLVDTGFGVDDCRDPSRLEALLRVAARPRLQMEETARHRIEALGLDPLDVRHIVPTHLDVDHSGGLPDFPDATVHVFRPEKEAALAPQTLIERRRYNRHHFAHGPKWRPYEVDGEPWFGFETVRGLEGLPPEILLVPLVGHTRGHCGVAVKTESGWLLHAGDAYFHRGEKVAPPTCPAPLRAFQRIFAVDDAKRRQNQARLRSLVETASGEVRVFCAHDGEELREQGGA